MKIVDLCFKCKKEVYDFEDYHITYDRGYIHISCYFKYNNFKNQPEEKVFKERLEMFEGDDVKKHVSIKLEFILNVSGNSKI